MMRFLLACALFAGAGLFPPGAAAAPEVGDTAPDWTLPGSDGQTHSLSALRGSWVVISFFPKAYTGG